MENAIQIKIGKSEGGKTIVSARELYEQLQVNTKFNDWFKRMVEYGFIENHDFALVTQKRVTNNFKNPYTTFNDYAITIDMAKELCMIQRTPIGKQCRNYFIECERKLKETGGFAIPQTYSQALALAAKQAEQIEQQQKQLAAQNQQLTEQKPKVEFYDAVAQVDDTLSVEYAAKIINKKAIGVPKFGRNKLFSILRETEILFGKGRNIRPYQKYIDWGYFKLLEYKYDDKKGVGHVGVMIRVTQKGLAYIIKTIKKYYNDKRESEQQNQPLQLHLDI